MNFDFGFSTFGYDAPVATPAPSTPTPEAVSVNQESQADQPTSTGTSAVNNTTLNTGSSEGTNQAPSTNTSSSIVAPAELKIQQIAIENKPVLSLSWTASKTTTIDGYKIFRSKSEKTGYKNIAKIDKKVLEYKDAQVEVGKTYYYQVRAYKSTLESKSSNTVLRTVEAVVIASVEPTMTFEPMVVDAVQEIEEPSKPWWLLIFLIILVALGVLYKLKKWPFNKLAKPVATKQ